MKNLPNKLTILRMIFVPFVIFFILTDYVPGSRYIAAGLFVIASITDWFDGRIARKYNLISGFGEVMDPLADKLIVVAVILCLVKTGVFPVWCAMLILARDFLVTGMRVIAVSKNINVAARMWGKVKTAIQMVAMPVAVLFGESTIPAMHIGVQVCIYIATIATVVSGIVYTYDYRKVFE